MWPSKIYEEPKPGVFQRWAEALFCVVTIVLIEALLSFIVIAVLTIGSVD